MMRTVIPEVNKTKDDSYINPIFFFREAHFQLWNRGGKPKHSTVVSLSCRDGDKSSGSLRQLHFVGQSNRMRATQKKNLQTSSQGSPQVFAAY